MIAWSPIIDYSKAFLFNRGLGFIDFCDDEGIARAVTLGSDWRDVAYPVELSGHAMAQEAVQT